MRGPFPQSILGNLNYNCLTIHLNLVVNMYAQEFYKFETFPFYTIIWEWGKENYIMENSRWPLVRNMAILICMGIVGFLLALRSMDVLFFFFNFWNIYLGFGFRVVWIMESKNSRFFFTSDKLITHSSIFLFFVA